MAGIGRKRRFVKVPSLLILLFTHYGRASYRNTALSFIGESKTRNYAAKCRRPTQRSDAVLYARERPKALSKADKEGFCTFLKSLLRDDVSEPESLEESLAALSEVLSDADADDDTLLIEEDDDEEFQEEEVLDDDEVDAGVMNLLPNIQSSEPLSLENLDALLTESSNIAYFYLQNEIGLPEETMWKITLEAGSVLGMTANTLRHKIDLLRRTMDLNDEDIRVMLGRHPTILHMSADKNLAPKILFLVRALDLSKEELRAIIVQYPSVLCYSKLNLKFKVNFFLKLMAYTAEECRALFVSEPKLLTAGVKTGLIPHMRFFLKDMEIPLDKFRQIIQKNPKLMLYSLEDNLVPKLVFFLVMTLQFTPAHVQRLLLSYPQILDYNLDSHMLPISRYLMQELGFAPIEVRQIFLKFPRLMTHSLGRLKHVVGLLRFELGLEAAHVKRTLYQAPQSIGLTDDTLKAKIAFLRDSFQLSDNELLRVLAGMPTLILCSIESNLGPKAIYLLDAFGNDSDELRETIVTQPALLGYSLEKRVRPRMEKLLAAGFHPRGISIAITMKDEAFEKWLEGRKERLAKNPALEALSRAEKKKQKEEKAKKIDTFSPIKRKVKSFKDGRILHWTRERQPRS